MRIAVWHNLPSGGGKRALYDQVAGLLGRGHHVESWCPPTADQKFLPMGDLVREHVLPMSASDDTVLKRGLQRISKDATGVHARLRAMDQHARSCASEINRSGSDIVFAASSAAFAVTGLARYVECPSVLYLGEPLRYLYEALPRLPWPALPARRPGLMAVIQRIRGAAGIRALRVQSREELEGVEAYNRVLANSYFSRESMLRAYGIEARVCYLGVDTKRFVDRGLHRDDLVVGIGAFVRSKRIEAAIEAVATIRPPRPSITWIGNNADEVYLGSLADLARQRGVEFAPLVGIPHSQVVDVLNDAAVMVYAPRLEPFGYAPLEAGACGVPVVAKAEGGVRESVIDGETGILVDTDAGIGPALQYLLADDAAARRMREAARRNVEANWSLDAAGARLEAHLLEVAGMK